MDNAKKPDDVFISVVPELANAKYPIGFLLLDGRLLVVEEILDIYTNGPDIILEVNLAPKCGDYDVPPSFKGRVVTDLRNTFISIGDVRIAIKHMKNCSGQVVIR
jgi:hypothetical protein